MENKEYGLHLHHLLEHIHLLWDENICDFIINCNKVGIYEKDLYIVHDLVKAYSWLLSPYKEIEMLTSNGLIRIDCLIEFDDEVWVIDFKTGSYVEEYEVQIKNYVSEIKKIMKDRVIKGFILWILKKELERFI